VTASHLEKEWNGVKFSYDNAVELFEEDNMKVRDAVLGGRLKAAPKPGEKRNEEVIGRYKEFLLSRIPKANSRMKVVVDCGNGTGGLVAPRLFEAMGFSVETLFGEVNGNFPNRSSEITDETLGKLKERAREADFGVAFDGDSDRMVLVDGKGRLLGPEVTSQLILSELTKKEKGPIIANVECLKVMDEIAEKLGREIRRIRVGNSFMVHEVEKRKACFGVERSGHFCIPSIIPMDDGIAASMYAASALSRTGKSLSEIHDSVPRYPFAREKVECPDDVKFGVIESLKKRLSREHEKVNTMDGVRVDFDYGWVLVRASNTSPVIRVSAEADDEKRLKDITGRFLALLEEELEKTARKA
jgi:phosphomannomutase